MVHRGGQDELGEEDGLLEELEGVGNHFVVELGADDDGLVSVVWQQRIDGSSCQATVLHRRDRPPILVLSRLLLRGTIMMRRIVGGQGEAVQRAEVVSVRGSGRSSRLIVPGSCPCACPS